MRRFFSEPPGAIGAIDHGTEIADNLARRLRP
jgi:hypothetical protein